MTKYAVSFIMLLLASCAFGPGKTKSMLAEIKNEKFDAVIVPGVPFRDGKWSPIMKSRVYWSKYLYDNHITKNLIYSGGAVYSPYVEAEIMAMYAEEIGINRDNIFTETKAEHSTENAYYSWRLAKQLGFKKIALASDPFQTKMLKSFIRRKMKNEITLIPFVFDTIKAMKPMMIDPEIKYQKAYRRGFISIKKRENLGQRLKGTMGLRIDTSVYKNSRQYGLKN